MQELQTFGISALLVALAEMGDRTQLLTILLASRYKKPVAILAGVLAATLANHLCLRENQTEQEREIRQRLKLVKPNEKVFILQDDEKK